MTEESTPVLSETNGTSETSTAAETADILENNENDTAPASDVSEPENPENETAEKPEKTEELLAGKYKNVDELIKAYKEAEKYIPKSKELEKQLQVYKDLEEKAKQQREAVAKTQGFDDFEQQQMNFDVKNHEFLAYVKALDGLSGEAYQKAREALARYQTSMEPRDLRIAQSFFNPAVVAEIAGDTALYENKRAAEYAQNINQKRFENVRQELETFARQTEGWLNIKERQDVIGLAINLTGGNVDFNQVKTLLDAVEKAAVDRYLTEQKAAAENKAVQNSLQSPSDANLASEGEHWFTREEYNKLTPEQENKYYDKIVRQIELEKQGKLPKRLTRD